MEHSSIVILDALWIRGLLPTAVELEDRQDYKRETTSKCIIEN